MFKVFGFGEDALTHYVLTKQTEKVLSELKDNSVLANCILFFTSSNGSKNQSLIDECDAILITPNYMYLIQSKWIGSTEIKRRGDLTRVHGMKHQVITMLAQNWDGSQDYESYRRASQKAFDKAFEGNEFVQADSIVDHRLFDVLARAKQLSTDGSIHTRSVYLLISEKDAKIGPIIVPHNFILVKMEYEPMDESYFFLISGNDA